MSGEGKWAELSVAFNYKMKLKKKHQKKPTPDLRVVSISAYLNFLSVKYKITSDRKTL